MTVSSDPDATKLHNGRTYYWANFGLLGYCARFSYEGTERLQRGEQVLLRTHRGIELGHILWPDDTSNVHTNSDEPKHPPNKVWPVTGNIIRAITPSDPWLSHHRSLLDDLHRWFDQQLTESATTGIICELEYIYEPAQLGVLHLGLPPQLLAQLSLSLQQEFNLLVEWYDATELLAADDAWEERRHTPREPTRTTQAIVCQSGCGHCRCSTPTSDTHPNAHLKSQESPPSSPPTSSNSEAGTSNHQPNGHPVRFNCANQSSLSAHQTGSPQHACTSCVLHTWFHRELRRP
ncbi:MAG: hypothetical protein RMI91_07010 [Gemmatales bacterium]|nr:hypothetical protein [Gemmatales bacterium]MDW7994387.1 hypothetical protein [Gemmatales bacterium]